MVNLIIYKHEPGMRERITRTNAVADYAGKKGLPARATYSPRMLQLRSDSRTRYAALYHYLPGSTIPWEAYTMDHIKALGKGMSDLHAALSDFNAHSLPDVATECLHLHGRIRRYFSDQGVRQAMRHKLGLDITVPDSARLFAICQKLPNQQALHMDFVRGNILFTETTITGMLDFEKTARGHTVFDIARTLAFLLVDCKYKQQAKIRKYFLVSGYQKRGAAKFQHIIAGQFDILEELVKFFLLHDFYKFLRHNPYESLAGNEHFIRTKALLLAYGLIHQSDTIAIN